MLWAWLPGVTDLCRLTTDTKTIYNYILFILCLNYEKKVCFCCDITLFSTIILYANIYMKSELSSHVTGMTTGRKQVVPSSC